MRQAQLQTWLEIWSEVGRQCFFSSSKWFEIWHLFNVQRFVAHRKFIGVHDAFVWGQLSTHLFDFFEKSKWRWDIGEIPLSQNPLFIDGYWYKSPTWQLPVSPGWPDMPSSFQRCQAQMWETPPECCADSWNFQWLEDDWPVRMACFFSRGSVSWRFKLGRLLYTSRYIPIKMKHGPWKSSGWEVYDPLLCKDAICFLAWQVDSFRGMYMAKFEECTTATPRKMVIFLGLTRGWLWLIP